MFLEENSSKPLPLLMQYYTFKWSWKTAQAISLFFTLQKARNSESYLVQGKFLNQSQSIIILFKLAVVLTKLIVQVVVLLLFGFRTWLWSLGRLIPDEFFCSQKRLWIGVLWYLKTPCIFFFEGEKFQGSCCGKKREKPYF